MSEVPLHSDPNIWQILLAARHSFLNFLETGGSGIRGVVQVHRVCEAWSMVWNSGCGVCNERSAMSGP